eukprot:scaffold2376_cov188-Amphora_coffeaeformis.AAC.5
MSRKPPTLTSNTPNVDTKNLPHDAWQQQQQASSEEEAPAPTLPEYKPLRLRAGSDNSIRGAFTSEERPVHVPSGVHLHHHHHHHSEGHNNTNTTNTSNRHGEGATKRRSSPRKNRKNNLAEMAALVTAATTDDGPDEEAALLPLLLSTHDTYNKNQQPNPKQAFFHAQNVDRMDGPGSGEMRLSGSTPRAAASTIATTTAADARASMVRDSLQYSEEFGSQRLAGSAIMTSSSMSPPNVWSGEPTPSKFYNSVDNDVDQGGYYDEYSDDSYDDDDEYTEYDFWEDPWNWCLSWMYLRHYDLNPWLTRDILFDENEKPYFPARSEWTLAGAVRHYFYNPITPEFTSVQQFCWAVVIGVVMGVYTAVWKIIVENGVEFVWEKVPAWLVEHKFFTEVHGWFPLYHYVWIVPTIFGAALSYIFVILPVQIPGQNEWISSLHKSGVQDYRTFFPLFVLSTLGMLSGLSLGPELPLVLTSGMFGSWLGLICRQSMLQARVLNLTAASAAIGGFFGFPMAGALFVLELPHRSGLQYFEALTPSTISSIVAVIANRLVVNNDVTGYFKYPFLATSLPSSIFWHSIVYGLFGCAVGTGYLFMVIWCKNWVHDWFHAPHDDHDHHDENDEDEAHDEGYPEKHLKKSGTSPTATSSNESDTLLAKKTKKEMTFSERKKSIFSCIYSFGCVVIPKESHRAALAGAVAGFICGWVAIFVPHTLFWGEAQLQNLIDKGRTPLPIFGDATGDMVALGMCIIDPSDPAAIKAGFSPGCAFLIAITKIFVIGLSLGTGIIGGHFWGPLFVGCAASHFFSDIVNIVANHIGFGRELATYPCLVILCTMGSAHVVSFRAQMAIMLILTLTISAFSPEDGNPYYGMAGDYSAVFPLLVISVSLSMILSHGSVFYKEQRNRGDILAVPQVLCEPGMEGEPLVVARDSDSDEGMDGDHWEEVGSVHSAHGGDAGSVGRHSFSGVGSRRGPAESESELARVAASGAHAVRTVMDPMTMDDIEDDFFRTAVAPRPGYGSIDPYSSNPPSGRASPVVLTNPPSTRASPLPPTGRSSPSATVKKTISSIGTGVTVPPPLGFPPMSASIPPMAMGVVPPPPMPGAGHASQLSSTRLDELLAMPLEQEKEVQPTRQRRQSSRDLHRRTNSLPLSFMGDENQTTGSGSASGSTAQVTAMTTTQSTYTNRGRTNSASSRQDFLRVPSFGEVEHAPSLLEQARMQAASISHRRVPSLPRARSRKNSSSNPSDFGVDSGALSLDDIEQSFNNMVNSRSGGFQQGNVWRG